MQHGPARKLGAAQTAGRLTSRAPNTAAMTQPGSVQPTRQASAYLQLALDRGGLLSHALCTSLPAAFGAWPPHQGQVGQAGQAGQEAAGGLGAVH